MKLTIFPIMLVILLATVGEESTVARGHGSGGYSTQKNPVFNAVLLHCRMRFNALVLLSRQDDMRKALGTMQEGYLFRYLPDKDFASRDALFVPFFGVNAVTLTRVSRLARLTGAYDLKRLTFQPRSVVLRGIQYAED